MNYLAAAVTVLLAAPVVLAYLCVIAAEVVVAAWLGWRLIQFGRRDALAHDAERCSICHRATEKQ